MGTRYGIMIEGTVGNPKTILSLYQPASPVTRACIAYVGWGIYDTPQELQFKMILQRFTLPGTATALTPRALDPLAGTQFASQMTAGSNHSGEPTYTANDLCLRLASNFRATPQWWANPGYEHYIPAAASNGIGTAISHGSYTGTSVEITEYFDE